MPPSTPKAVVLLPLLLCLCTSLATARPLLGLRATLPPSPPAYPATLDAPVSSPASAAAISYPAATTTLLMTETANDKMCTFTSESGGVQSTAASALSKVVDTFVPYGKQITKGADYLASWLGAYNSPGVKASEVWDCVKDYVAEYVTKAINKEKIQMIKQEVAGIVDQVERDIGGNDLGTIGYKSAFAAVLSDMQRVSSTYFECHNNCKTPFVPVQVLPELAQFGSMFVAARASDLLFYSQINTIEGQAPSALTAPKNATKYQNLLGAIKSYTQYAHSAFDDAWAERNAATNYIAEWTMETHFLAPAVHVLHVQDKYTGFELESSQHDRGHDMDEAYYHSQRDADFILAAEKSREQTQWWISMQQLVMSPVNSFPAVLPHKSFAPTHAVNINQTIPFGNCGNANRGPDCDNEGAVVRSRATIATNEQVHKVQLWLQRQSSDARSDGGAIAAIEMFVVDSAAEVAPGASSSLGQLGNTTTAEGEALDSVELVLQPGERIVRTEMWSYLPNNVITEVYAMRLTTSLGRNWSTWEDPAWPKPANDKYKYDLNLADTAGKAWACGTSARLGYTQTLGQGYTTAIGFDWCYDMATVECHQGSGDIGQCNLDVCPHIPGLEKDYNWYTCTSNP